MYQAHTNESFKILEPAYCHVMINDVEVYVTSSHVFQVLAQKNFIQIYNILCQKLESEISKHIQVNGIGSTIETKYYVLQHMDVLGFMLFFKVESLELL